MLFCSSGLKNGVGFVMNKTHNFFEIPEETMKVRSYKYIWISVLFLMVCFVAFPDPIFSKTAKPSQRAQKTRKIQTQQATQPVQTTKEGLQFDAQSAVLMDGLTGQILYEQNPTLKIPRPVSLKS